jgi:hypothetical protein
MTKGPSLAALLLVGATFGCAAGAQNGGTATASANTTATATATVAPSEIQNRSFLANLEMRPLVNDVPAGEYVMEFSARDVRVLRGGSLVFEAEYEIAGNELRMSARRGNLSCNSPPVSVYTVHMSGATMHLQRRTDSCQNTVGMLTTEAWARR